MTKEQKITGTYVPKYKRKILFTKELTLKTKGLRRWRPFIYDDKA